MSDDYQVNQYPEYELRHPDGTVDEFDDIGDAVDFRDNNGFKDSVLYQRQVTELIVKDEWVQA